jgi:hypothetical protein
MSLDNIIIVDNVPERADALVALANGKAREVEVMMMGDPGEPLSIAETFRGRISELLGSGANVMVVFCCMTGVKGEVVRVLRDAEAKAGKGTRRILIDCHGTDAVNRGFKNRGVPRGGIRHIRYDMDERWQQRFADLFN